MKKEKVAPPLGLMSGTAKRSSVVGRGRSGGISSGGSLPADLYSILSPSKLGSTLHAASSSIDIATATLIFKRNNRIGFSPLHIDTRFTHRGAHAFMETVGERRQRQGGARLDQFHLRYRPLDRNRICLDKQVAMQAEQFVVEFARTGDIRLQRGHV